MKLKQILTVLAVAAATVALVGCERPKGINVTSKEFERKVTEGVYKVAKAQYAFNKTTDQLYFNKATNIVPYSPMTARNISRWHLPPR